MLIFSISYQYISFKNLMKLMIVLNKLKVSSSYGDHRTLKCFDVNLVQQKYNYDKRKQILFTSSFMSNKLACGFLPESYKEFFTR